MFRRIVVLLLIATAQASGAEEAVKPDAALQQSVEQLRNAIGRWDVVTKSIGEDGAVNLTADGSYEFEWVVPDRVVSGRSEIPDLGQASGILFYIRESSREIEMVSVGADGRLWIMTGPLGEEQRTTREFKTREGQTAQLRFTRYNVSENAFESRMDYTTDGGETWTQGNHQQFRRAGSDANAGD